MVRNAVGLVFAAAVFLFAARWAILWAESAWFRAPFNRGDDELVITRADRFLSMPGVAALLPDQRFLALHLRGRARLAGGGELNDALVDLEAAAHAVDEVGMARTRRSAVLALDRRGTGAQAHEYFAVALFRAGRYHEAEERALEAMRWSATTNRRVWLQSLRALATTEIRRGLWTSAHLHADYALAVATRAADPDGSAEGARLLGQLAFARRDWALAHELFLRYVEDRIARGRLPDGARRDLITTTQQLAITAAHAEDLMQATAWWSKSEELLAATARPSDGRAEHFSAVCQFHEAVLWRLRGNVERAEVCARASTEGFRGRDLDLYWFAQRELARASRAQGDPAAEGLYGDVIAWFDRTDVMIEAQRTRAELADPPSG